MNQEMEDLLRKRKPRPPSNDLDRRIEQALDPGPQMEDLLKGQNARRPSPDLDRRIEAVLASRKPAATRPPIRQFWWLAAAVVAVVAIVLAAVVYRKLSSRPVDGADSPKPELIVEQVPTVPAEPDVVEGTWSHRQMGSAILLPNDVPVRPVLESTVQYTRWVDPETNDVYERAVPARRLYFVTSQMH